MKEQRRLAGLKSGEVRRLKAEQTLRTTVEHPLNDEETEVERNPNGNEQSKEKESNKRKVKYKAFIDWFNQSMIKVKGKEGNYKPLAAVKKSFEARLKDGYVFEDFEKAFNNIVADDYHKEQNYKYLTPKFLTNSEKLEKWANADEKPKPKMPERGKFTNMTFGDR